MIVCGEADYGSFVILVKRNCDRILIFLRNPSAEAHFFGRTKSTVAVFLLPLCLAFEGETGMWDCLKAGGRDFPFGNLAISVCAPLDAAEGLFDLIKCVLLFCENRECEVTVVGIAARVALMLATSRCLATFRSVADGVAGHA